MVRYIYLRNIYITTYLKEYYSRIIHLTQVTMIHAIAYVYVDTLEYYSNQILLLLH